MTLKFDNCSSHIEQIGFYAWVIFFFTTIFTVVMTFHREHVENPEKYKFSWTELLGFIEVFVTDRGLNNKGKFWRKWLIASSSILAFVIFMMWYFETCSSQSA